MLLTFNVLEIIYLNKKVFQATCFCLHFCGTTWQCLHLGFFVGQCDFVWLSSYRVQFEYKKMFKLASIFVCVAILFKIFLRHSGIYTKCQIIVTWKFILTTNEEKGASMLPSRPPRDEIPMAWLLKLKKKSLSRIVFMHAFNELSIHYICSDTFDYYTEEGLWYELQTL